MEVRPGFKVTLSYIVSSRPVRVYGILFQNQKETPKAGVEKKRGKIDSQDIAILEVVTITGKIPFLSQALCQSSVFLGLGRDLHNFFSVH